MTRQWAATNTLRDSLMDPTLIHSRDALGALALVETALDAAEETRELLSSIQVEAGHPIFGTYERLAAALRAVREGK